MSALDDPNKELRSEEPTAVLAWDDGVLVQKWEQHWAGWEGSRWRHWKDFVWRRVPAIGLVLHRESVGRTAAQPVTHNPQEDAFYSKVGP